MEERLKKLENKVECLDAECARLELMLTGVRREISRVFTLLGIDFRRYGEMLDPDKEDK